MIAERRIFLSPTNLDEMFEAIRNANAANPQFPVGRLMDMAASIARAQLNVRAGSVTDEEMVWGLRALVPIWDEEDQKWL